MWYIALNILIQILFINLGVKKNVYIPITTLQQKRIHVG